MLQKQNGSSPEILPDANNRLVFDASHRRLLIRFITAISVAFPVLVAFLVLRMPEEQLISDLGGPGAGRVFQAGLIIVSGIFLYIMAWLSGRYVLTIFLQGSDTILINAWHLFLPNKTYQFHSSQFVQPPVFNRGETKLVFTPIVQAPYHTIRVDRKKFILDQQGRFPEGEELLLGLVGG